MKINPSFSINHDPTAPTIQSQNQKLKIAAEQMVLNTERSFSRILGQLLTDRENNGSFSTPVSTFLPDFPTFTTVDIINGQVQTPFNEFPEKWDISQTSTSSNSLQHTNHIDPAAGLNRVLGGKLKGAGKFFVAAGNKYGVNPALLASISMHETGNGSSKAANERNNISGTMTSKGLRNYSSIEESIMDMARNLRENYFNKGLNTIQEIANKYAPIGAKNDPNSLNQFWVSQVSKNLNNLSV